MARNAQHIKQDNSGGNNKHPKGKHSDNSSNQSMVASFLQVQGKYFISIIIVAAVLIMLVVFSVINLGSTEEESSSSANAALNSTGDSDGMNIFNGRQDTNETEFFDPLDSTALSTIIDLTTPGIISLSNEDGFSGRTLSEDDSQSLSEALLPYTSDNVPVGFLLINLNTGYGISYNIDTEIYGASTFKAAYVLYICQNFLETGIRTLDDSITYYLQDEDDQSYFVYGTDSLREIIYECIIESDNGAYVALRKEFDESGFDTWLASFDCNVTSEEDSYFPTYNVRNASKIWLEIYNYLNTDTETANYFKGLLMHTETSFLRKALNNYEGIEIADKAGWYDAGDETTSIYDCVNDSGIITFEGTEYIFCMMTAIADNDITENDFESLTDTIFSLRYQLTDESN